jgi:peptide/nickel transport system substrate-binding protein
MESPGGTLVIDAFDDPTTLDPHKAFDTGSRHPVLNLYDGLLELDPSGTVRPLLAVDVPVQRQRGDGVDVVVQLRDDVFFHDGSPMRPEDVVYSLRRLGMTADGPAGLLADALLGEPIATLTVDAAEAMARRVTETDGGLLLRLPGRFTPLNLLLVQWSLVVSRQWCADRGEWDGDLATIRHFVRPTGTTALDRQANGTGPYALDAWDRVHRQLRFRRAPGRRGGPAVVVLRSEDDRITRERNLLEGRCDFSVCQPESVDRLGDHAGVVLDKLPDEWSINPLGFITQRLDPNCAAVGSGRFGPDGLPPDAFTDLHLRRMLTLSFDHDRYVTEVLDGEGLPHIPPFPAPSLVDPPTTRPEFDLDRARWHLASACDGEAARRGFRLVVVTHGTNISRLRAAEILAEGVRSLSPRLRVEVEQVDLPKLVDRLYARQCPVAWAGWASDFLHPYAFASTLLDPRAPLPNALGIDDPVLRELVVVARHTDGPGEPAVYRAMAIIATREALFVAPPGKVSYMTYSDRWKNVRLKNHVSNVLDFASFEPRVGSPA